jgi:PEP-CTERM motif
MRIKNWLAGAVAAGALAFGTPAAQAALICQGCEYGGDAGTYLGTYNPDDFDFGTFQHSDVGQDVGPDTAFEDYWVFDLEPGGSGSMSADYTMLTGIPGFTSELYTDGGSTCAGSSCSSVVLGALLATDVAGADRRWEIIEGGLAAGRYIIRVTGMTNAMGDSTSAYTGQLAFIPEPGTLALLGLGLIALGLARRRKAA